MSKSPEQKPKTEQLAPPIEVRWRPVAALEPDPRNPRIHTDRQVARIADSISAFGFNVPVLIDGRDRVVAGHARLLAARRLGLAEVPTIALGHLSEEGRRAFMIADNRLGELASWDESRLRVELEELKTLELDFDLAATGFEMRETDLRIEAVDAGGVPGSGPGGVGRDRGSRLEPVARAGDAWSLGPHRLVCGDATEPAAFLAVDAAIRRWQAAVRQSAALDPDGESFDAVARARRRPKLRSRA